MTRAYIVQQGSKDITIPAAKSITDAFRLFRHHAVGKNWSFTRQPNGWVVCSPSANKQLERTFFKIREANWSRGERYPI
jgi:hypothetical protein